MFIGAALTIAGETGGVPQAVVKFGDLNLSNPQSVTSLYNRVYVAGYKVCQSFDTDIRNQADFTTTLNACVDDAIRNALTKIARSELFAIYNASHPVPLQIRVVAAQNH
jgi:UrcA family protein